MFTILTIEIIISLLHFVRYVSLATIVLQIWVSEYATCSLSAYTLRNLAFTNVPFPYVKQTT